MRRRDFIALVGGAAAAWPLPAGAQDGVRKVGFLGVAPAAGYTGRLAALRAGLADLGFVEGKNIAFDLRWAEGTEQLDQFAAELVTAGVAIIITSGNTATLAAKSATTTIPIVFSGADDPVRLGVVASFNEPGGNMTGVSLVSGGLGAKRIELIRELVPKATLIGMLRNPKNPAEAEARDEQAVAQSIGQQLLVLNAVSVEGIDAAFVTLADRRADALLVNPDVVFTAHREQIVGLAARHKIPALYPWREFAESGGLISYGPSFAESYHQMGVYAGRILRGVKPGALPVMQPTAIELVLNLKTAQTLGVQISSKLLALADAVIE